MRIGVMETCSPPAASRLLSSSCCHFAASRCLNFKTLKHKFVWVCISASFQLHKDDMLWCTCRSTSYVQVTTYNDAPLTGRRFRETRAELLAYHRMG
eukprot:365360-Chlamydomonas_euryale.AAC.2